MKQGNPVVTIAGKIPAVGRTAVKNDYRIGRHAAEIGDRDTCVRMARSLGTFALKHVPFAVVSGASMGVHITQAFAERNGIGTTLEAVQAVYDGLYTSAQTAFIYVQNQLSQKLYERAATISDVEISGIEAPETEALGSIGVSGSLGPVLEQEKPKIPPGDIRFTAIAHTAFAATVTTAVIDTYTWVA